MGPGPLVGCQLRYLIRSAHGWLGGFGFSAAALNLRDRDAWIGWDSATRQAQLHRVLGMSRFLLRPRDCHNLASQVLGQVLKRVADDFEHRFGYRPYLLESFVDTTRFDGTCYRAANFQRVGATQGRGDRIGDMITTRRSKTSTCIPCWRTFASVWEWWWCPRGRRWRSVMGQSFPANQKALYLR